MKKNKNMSPHTYSQRLLMFKACELLSASENETVAQISKDLGYKHPQSFIKAFEGAMGITPTQWREKNTN